jgi:hypothetical protein
MNQAAYKNLLYTEAWCRTVKENPDLYSACKDNTDKEARLLLKKNHILRRESSKYKARAGICNRRSS